MRRGDKEDANEHDQHADRRQRHHLQHLFEADAPPEGMKLRLPPEEGQRRQDHHHEGRHLDPARGRGRPAPDQHQRNHHQRRAVMQPADIGGVEPRRPCRHPLEPAHRQPGDGAVMLAQRGGVAPFQHRETPHRPHDQHRRPGQHDPRMQAPALPPPLAKDVLQDDIADPPGDEEKRNDDIHHRIGRIGHEPLGKGRKPRVVEGRNRVEHRLPQPPRQPVFPHEDQRQQRRPGPLADQNHLQDRPYQLCQPPERGLVQILPQIDMPGDPDRQAQRPQHQHGKGHQAQPAQLYEQQQNPLPEIGQVAPGIDHRQPRHRHGRGGSKDRIRPAHRHHVRHRHLQHGRARQNQHAIDRRQDQRRRHP